jgi:Zn-dependent protease
MDNSGRHIGFRGEAPQEVNWSEFSYIKPVEPDERRQMRKICIFITFGPLIVVLLGILIYLGRSLVKYVPALGIVNWNLISLVLVLGGAALFIVKASILRAAMIKKISRRYEKLFEPDKECILIGIEDVFTYDKRKASPDDFGLLKITPESVYLEMTEYRGQFHPSDLSASILHTGKTAAGVRLSCNQQPFPWSVVLYPLSIQREFGPAKQSKKLCEIFAANGVGTGRENSTGIEKGLSISGIPEANGSSGQFQSAVFPADEHSDLLEDRYQKVLEEINKRKKKKSYFKNLAILVISLLVFFQLGLFYWDLKFVLLILVVLIVHESGHFLGMKMFGYKNLQMFFIPMFGAAVSGTGRNVATWKKAIVSLLGPLPGIILSVFLFIGYLISSQQIYYEAGTMFLILNLLNLLPIVPLDGGRFLNEVLFSRNRYIELGANILAAGAFLISGFWLNSWVLKILGFLNLLTLQYTFKLATAAKNMRKDLIEQENSQAEGFGTQAEQEIPEKFLKKMISWIYRNMPGPIKPKTAATTVLQMWERISISPPKWGATTALLVVFVMGYIISFLSLGALAVCTYKGFADKTKIISYEGADGKKRYKEQSYFLGKLSSETELSDDQKFYHGIYTLYDWEGKTIGRGQWELGKRIGQWEHFDPNGLVINQTSYGDGKPVLIKRFYDGQWIEEAWEQFSEFEKKTYTGESQMQQGPGRVFEIDYSELLEDINEVPE